MTHVNTTEHVCMYSAVCERACLLSLSLMCQFVRHTGSRRCSIPTFKRHARSHCMESSCAQCMEPSCTLGPCLVHLPIWFGRVRACLLAGRTACASKYRRVRRACHILQRGCRPRSTRKW